MRIALIFLQKLVKMRVEDRCILMMLNRTHDHQSIVRKFYANSSLAPKFSLIAVAIVV